MRPRWPLVPYIERVRSQDLDIGAEIMHLCQVTLVNTQLERPLTIPGSRERNGAIKTGTKSVITPRT